MLTADHILRQLENADRALIQVNTICRMKLAVVFGAALLSACHKQIPQTVIVRANAFTLDMNSLWLVESPQCTGKRIMPRLYRNGLWIFKLSSTRGGIGTVTQELTLCYQGTDSSPIKMWHSLQGGGSSLIVLSCGDETAQDSCGLYMDQHTQGTWEENKI